MPFDFFGFSNGPGRGPEENYRGRSQNGPPFGHPDDLPEEYGVPQRAKSWWAHWRPPCMGREGFSGPPFNFERGPEGWRGPPWRHSNRDGPPECENVRPEGWRGPPWWCFRDRGFSSETGEYSRPEGWRGPPWMWNRDPGNFTAETGERRPEWRGPPWMRDGPEGGRHPEGWRGPPWMWNRDGPGHFSNETGEHSRPEWRGPPWWMFRGENPGNEGWRRPH